MWVHRRAEGKLWRYVADMSERVDFLKACHTQIQRSWWETALISLKDERDPTPSQVILGHKNALPNSISSDCNLANTLQAASRRKKKVRKSVLVRALRPEPLSWCVGGKKAAEGKLAALTWSQWLLEYMIIIIYAVSSVKAVLSNLKMDEKLIAPSQVYKISAAW